MKVIVKTIDEKELPVIVTGDLKVKQFKACLERILGYYIEDKFLIFKRKIMRDSETLQELDVQNLSTINLCEVLLPHSLREPLKIVLFVKTPDGNKTSMIVTSNMKVEHLSEIIQSTLEYPINEQYLLFENKYLKKDQTLSEQGIRNSCIIQLIEKLLPSTLCESVEILIFIKRSNGKRLPIRAYNDIKVKQLLVDIQRKYLILTKTKRLIFRGKFLGQENNLKELGICNSSEIFLYENILDFKNYLSNKSLISL